jgi:hypothetical protein
MARLFAPKPPPEPEKPPVVAGPPTPPGMSRDDVKALLTETLAGVTERLASTMTQLNERVEQLATRQPQVVVQPAAPVQPSGHAGPTDADIDAAVMSGQGAAARIRSMIDKAVNDTAQRLIKEHIEPLQNYGVSTIGELSRRITVGSMPHYPRYKKEIDERLAALTPEVRANPAVIEMVYNSIVGVHATELAREAAEAAVRQAQEAATKPASGTPGSGASPAQRPTETEVPDVARIGGEAGLDALAHKGRGGQDADSFAQSMGYKSWADYMKMHEELLRAESQGNA